MKLLIAGASGVVGQATLALALNDQRVSLVVAPTRQPLAPHPKLLNPIIDFTALPSAEPWWAVDAMICALGTTFKIAGSAERFIAIDRDLVLSMARLARQHGAQHFALNSSLGASLTGNLYLRTKAEAEQGVRVLGFPRLLIVRPSLINAVRTPPRPAEHLGLCVSRLLGPLIPRRYRPVKPDAIAAAMLNGLFTDGQGEQVVESDQL